MQLILGSSSTARAKVLSQLKVPFTTVSPDIDETMQENETAASLVKRLGREKAEVLLQQIPEDSIIITGDQVLCVKGHIFGKPHTQEKAYEHLRYFSGKSAIFYSSICVYNNHTKSHQIAVCPTTITFKQLTTTQIKHYIALEKPLACAGCFKAEGLGISLISAMQSNDPTAILGLPLLTLCNMLEQENIDIIAHASC